MSIKRLNYFTGQFLKEKDFKDEQVYHTNALSMHNKNLHTWGIASGFDVSFIQGKKHVIVDSGMAIDKNGKQIILEEAREIDLSKAAATILYLTISYKEIEIDPTEETGVKGNTRISEDPLIEFDKSMPDDTSMKIFLAKVTLNPENKMIQAVDLKDRKYTGFSGDIEAKSIAFSLPIDHGKWPKIKGVDGSNPGLEIASQNTSLTGNLNVAGKLKGKLDKDIVGTDQIADKSVPISKIKAVFRSGSGSISANSEDRVQKIIEPSKTHRFFVTSVIPKTPDSSIEWRWQVEHARNQLSYVLVVKNLSDKTIEYDFKFYDILEK